MKKKFLKLQYDLFVFFYLCISFFLPPQFMFLSVGCIFLFLTRFSFFTFGIFVAEFFQVFQFLAFLVFFQYFSLLVFQLFILQFSVVLHF